jgi:hypothetical protein
MAFTGNAICNSFKQELLEGEHDFKTPSGDVFKLALYTSAATLDSSTTVYTSTNEISNPTGTYSAGGGTLVNSGTSQVGGVAFCDFADLSFTGVTLTARGALIYNTSATVVNAAVAVLDFTTDKSASDGTFTIIFPDNTSAAAILRISG